MKDIALILISHGEMAKETLKSAEMIAGNINGAYAVCMDVKEGPEGVIKKLKEVMFKLNDYKFILIMTDLMGGTPSNTAITQLYGKDNVRIISGFNLGMVLEFALSQDNNIDVLKDYLIEIGKNGIIDVLKRVKEVMDN